MDIKKLSKNKLIHILKKSHNKFERMDKITKERASTTENEHALQEVTNGELSRVEK